MEADLPSYQDFEQVENSSILKEKFIEQTDDRLKKILTKYRKVLRLSFHKAIGLDNLYLVMVVGVSDNILIELATKYNFPRGFPIIWIPDVMMQYFGFYPKFSNDDRQTPDSVSEFDDVIEINFFKKWSGFLGQLITFEYGGNFYWTVTSKNSASHESPFVKDAKRLFQPFINTKLIRIMAKKNLHICAEIMSKNDQTHGARVLKETPVITAIGKGCLYDLKDPKNSIINSSPFVEYFNNKELVNFCIDYDLPCDSNVTINTNTKNFMVKLSQNRDFMDDTMLNNLIYSCEYSFEVLTGTINHCDILGNCLEGLVIKLKYADGNQNTKKYKFAPYTIRTMLLREEFNNFIMRPSLMDRAKKFVDGWCVSERGKEYWYKMALHAFLTYPKFVSPDSDIGIHIHIADYIQKIPLNENVEKEFMTILSSMTAGTVIICLGPIGSGKTTFANYLAKKISNAFIIDGDVLDLDKDIVLKLGKERNDYTRWKIVQALMEGKVPIISTGGGALFTQDRQQKFELPTQIYNSLGINAQIIVCISGNFREIVPLNNDYDSSSIYEQPEYVKKTVIKRIRNGEWKMNPKYTSNSKISIDKAIENFANTIAKYSRGNSKFANDIIKKSNIIYGFPIITTDNYGIQEKFDYDQIIKRIITNEPFPSGKFYQTRLLVSINGTIGHITYKYNSDSTVQYSKNDFISLTNIFGKRNIPGRIFQLNSGKEKITICIPDESIHPDGSSHITIDPGNHAPKDMKLVALAIKNIEPKLSLPSKNTGLIEYDLTKAIITPCTIDILASFGI